jgi:hypothetical protein
VLQVAPPDSTIFVVEHVEPVFRLSRTHVIGKTSDTFTIELTTDGKEVVVNRGELRIRARAYWEGNTLVVDSAVDRGEDAGKNIVRYTLADPPHVLVAEERLRSNRLNYDNRWVLERQ